MIKRKALEESFALEVSGGTVTEAMGAHGPISAESSVVLTVRQDQHGPNPHDHSGDAINQARHHRMHGSAVPHVRESFSRSMEVLDKRQIELMADLGIIYDGNAFHLRGYRYDCLADAVNYAHLRRAGIAS